MSKTREHLTSLKQLCTPSLETRIIAPRKMKSVATPSLNIIITLPVRGEFLTRHVARRQIEIMLDSTTTKKQNLSTGGDPSLALLSVSPMRAMRMMDHKIGRKKRVTLDIRHL